MAIGDAQGSLRLVAVSTGAKIFGVTDGTYIADLTISPDGRLLVVASNAATTVRDAADGRVLKTLALPVPGGTTMVRFNDDGSTLATADLDGHVRLWDVATAAVTRDLDLVNGEASAVAFAHAEPYLATGTQGGRVTIWNTTTGASVGQLPTLLPRVNDLVYTPDDAVLVEASDDPRAYVWDAHQRTLLRTLRGKTGAVLSLAVSGDGQSVVAGGDDDTARVWDLASGRTLRILDGSTNAVTKVAYLVELSSKVETILTASGDGRVARWSACEWCRDAGLLGKQLDGATVRCLTADERRELLGETPSALKDEPCAA